MSIVISAVGISGPDASKNSIDHAAQAGLICLENAGLGVDDVDFLANVGIYRHHNMCEPAVCALIQNAMQMCPDSRKYPVKKNVFSFDLNNGGCGALSAVMSLGAMLEARNLDHGLIVGSDCHPSGGPDESFPFTPIGGALLLSRIAESAFQHRFEPVWIRTSPQPLDGQTGSCDILFHGVRSRTTVEVCREPDYLEQLQAFTRQTVNEYIESRAIERASLTLICSQPSPTFGDQLAAGTGLGVDRVVSTFDSYGDVHTSSLALGYHVARQNDLLSESDNLLFVEAGGGLTVGCAAYTRHSAQ